MALDILLPFWGDPALLRQTVDSVLAQRSPDWLLTIVDDCYPDPSVARYCTELAAGDDRIRYVRHETNQGITENYRACLELATQELVMFLGCDDLMAPDFVDVVLAAHATHPAAAVIQPGVEVIDEHGEPTSTLVDTVKQRFVRPAADGRQLLHGEELATSLLRGNWLYWPSLVFRRDVLARFEFRDGLPIVQDLALVMDMVFAGESLVLDTTPCFSYRRHSASASSSAIYDGRRFSGDRRYFAIAAQQASDAGWPRARRAARARTISRLHAASLLPGAVARGKFDAVKPLVTHALTR